MKKFKFTMQPLLKVRLSLEKQQKAEFAKAQQRVAECLMQLNGLYRKLEQVNEAYLQMAAQGTGVDELAVYSRYFQYINEEIEQGKADLAQAERHRDKARQTLVKTMQDRKVLEKLKESQLEQYMKDQQAEQDKEIGDMVSYRSIINQ